MHNQQKPMLTVFQSTPPRRRRPPPTDDTAANKAFQSTPPRRRRPESALSAVVLTISIHASAKEATRKKLLKRLKQKNFNPRLREGGDPQKQRQSKRKKNFNPRLREGGDITAMAVASDTVISIHASAKEATEIIVSSDFGMQFQSTPPRRRRRCRTKEEVESVEYFNPRLREGGD